MLRMFCLALVYTLVAMAQPAFQWNDRGTLSFGGDLAGIRATVNMHGPNWSGSSVEDGSARADGEGRVVGTFPAARGCAGSVQYTVAAQAVDGALELDYSVAFTESTTITGAYLSLFLPAAAFEGQQVGLLGGRASGVLPTGKDGVGVSGPASGVFVGKETGLAVVQNSTSRVLVQNNRQYGSEEYELRFVLFESGPVRPGLEARRVFRIARTGEKEGQEMAASLNPPRELRPDQPFLLQDKDGTLQLRNARRQRLASICLAVHGPNWRYTAQSDAKVATTGDARSRSFAGALAVGENPPGTTMEFAQTTTETGPAQARIDYRIHFPKPTLVNGYQLSITVPLSVYSGKGFRIQDGHRKETGMTIPPTAGESFLFSAPSTGFALAPGDPNGFRAEADVPMRLLVQDNRNWGSDSIEFRFCFARAGSDETTQAASIPAGHKASLGLSLQLPPDTQIVLDEGGTPSRTDTTEWFPFTLPWDSAPVDVSFLNHKPAGEHGFVTTRDGRFVLAETGEEIRFWGTCFSAGANFPSHEQAEKIARRLAAFGINMVRTHHADARWSERHFFPKDADHTRSFDAENLDRFDYLVHCLKQEGIYIYLDQLVNRYFKPGDGVDAVEELGACAKPYSNFDPRLIELQKEFSRSLWTHVNPYTKLAYKDDPAIALMEFANENDLFTQQVTLEPYRSRLETRYRAWVKERAIAPPEGPVDFTKLTDPLVRFLIDVQAHYYREMGDYLRDEVGVRVPMTGSNWSRNAALLLALDDLPFTDSHAYHNHPARDGAFGNTPMVGGSGTIMDGLGFQSRPGKPFFVSEWDEPWPNEWRAELAVWIAAVSAFQGWNGLTVYTYRHSSSVPIEHISGAFETFNDPARFGLFPHAALAYRRGDFATGDGTLLVQIPRDLAASAKSPSPWSGKAYRGLAETRRFRTGLGEAGQGVPLDQGVAEGNLRRSSSGQIRRDVEKRILLLDSPRTQAVTGFLAEAGPQQTSALAVVSDTLFATVAASALDERTLDQSERILLTAVGRAENTGFAYNLLRNRRVASGTGPILVDPVRARVSLRTSRRDLAVVPIAADGTRGTPLPTTYGDGALRFEIGSAKTIYYVLSAP